LFVFFTKRAQHMSAGAARKLAKPRTFYDILGVSRLAKEDEIRTAYLTLAKQYHPDVATTAAAGTELTLSKEEAETRFREVQEAYATLSNDWKRTVYDRDVQFQTAMSFAGSATSSDGVAPWQENFNLETPEARIARRERYKRYAAGERNDLPPPSLTTRGSLLGLLAGGVALTYVCAKAPSWFGGQGQQSFHDPVTDDHSVNLVRAYYNPIARTWERLGPGQDIPTVAEVIAQYKKLAPQLVDRWEYEEQREGNDVNTLSGLTVLKVPKTRTIPATVFRNASGQVAINKRTLYQAVSRFLNRIE